MKKEYVVKSIDASSDGAPYVVVSLASARDMREGNITPNKPPFGTKVMGFTNMNDMMKELNKMMSGTGSAPGVTTIKLDMHEYKNLGLSVGDKVYLELTKAENLDV